MNENTSGFNATKDMISYKIYDCDFWSELSMARIYLVFTYHFRLSDLTQKVSFL